MTEVKTIKDVLENLSNPNKLQNSPFLSTPFIQNRIKDNPESTSIQALRSVCDDLLEAITAESGEYGDLLRGRYWERLPVKAMRAANRPYPMSERTFFTLQKEAIARFETLFNERMQASESVELEPILEEIPPKTEEPITAGSQSSESSPSADDSSNRFKWPLIAAVTAIILLVAYLMWPPQNNGDTVMDGTAPDVSSELTAEPTVSPSTTLIPDQVLCYIDGTEPLPDTINCDVGHLAVTIVSNEDTGYPDWNRKMNEFINQIDLAPTVTGRAKIAKYGPPRVYDTLEVAGWITIYGQNDLNNVYPIEDEVSEQLVYFTPENVVQGVEVVFPKDVSGSVVATICEHSLCSGHVIEFLYRHDNGQ